MGVVDGSLVDFPVMVWSILKLLTALAHIHCMFGTTPGSVFGASEYSTEPFRCCPVLRLVFKEAIRIVCVNT